MAPASVACPDATGDALPHPPQLIAVGKTVWRMPAAEGESSALNGGVVTQAVLVVDGRRLWLVGSGPTPAFGAALACLIEAERGRTVTDIVNTRAHPELALANRAFGRARVWALPDVADAMGAQCGSCLDRLRGRIGSAGAGLTAEDIRVPAYRIGRAGADAGTLGPFAWQALPRAPGARTLVLQVRGEALLVAQGLVWVGGIPNLRETDSAMLLSSLRRLRAMAGGQRVIGEQGSVGGMADIDSHIAYLEALREDVRVRVERGDDEAGTLASISLPQFAALSGYADIHPLNRQRVWREFETALFR